MPKHLNPASIARGDRDLIAIRAAMNILEKWGCTTEQQQNILQLSRAALYKYRHSDTQSASLSHDQLTRVSYLLNIHSALRIVFSNPENVYGFMTMANQNAYFNGATPLSFIAGGEFGNLHEVAKRVDVLRGGLAG
ncbi:antitoxin Xre-like helix-turn-helix domain-containing protein [Silvania hatchlandensis]|uniref:MbcA/ParS/Xre antitoxin family protein n=1 Tax=Silvania hatchlandensis TaxID=2926469 RepID=A0A9J6Q669_9ENTR|nr:antitoxin Xre-like helix-turn-helix domain-containing protein [Silvania hatchlandensis]MCU6666585.1 MbcA/ParS/Xre antitoxin family protein [Silvania hatchlandensis]